MLRRDPSKTIATFKMKVFVVLLVGSLQPSTNVTKNSVFRSRGSPPLELSHLFVFFFFLSGFSFTTIQPFTNHRTEGEGGGHFFDSSLPLPPVSQTLKH